MTIRLGIIGCGAEGTMYKDWVAACRVPGMSVGAICDILPEKKTDADQLGVPFFEDYQDLIRSGTVDMVVTTVPHYLHPEMGIFALENAMPVLIEKPAGVYTKQVRELNECAQQHPDVPFGVFFNQRTNPLYQDLKALLDSGELGKLRHTSWIITTWWRPQPYYEQSAWRATWGGEGGGVLVNQAPHQLDLWQWLCGTPKSVFAKCGFGFRRNIVVEDEVNALVEFEDGATGSLMTCTHDLAGTDRLEILCDRGKIVVTGSKTVEITRFADDEQVMSQSMGMDAVRKLFTGQLDQAELMSVERIEYESMWGAQHCEVLRNFAAYIRGEEPLLAPGSDGMAGVLLANAIHLSSWLGKEVLTTDFDEEVYLAELNRRIQDEALFDTRK